jgi:hypothetical protein
MDISAFKHGRLTEKLSGSDKHLASYAGADLEKGTETHVVFPGTVVQFETKLE